VLRVVSLPAMSTEKQIATAVCSVKTCRQPAYATVDIRSSRGRPTFGEVLYEVGIHLRQVVCGLLRLWAALSQCSAEIGHERVGPPPHLAPVLLRDAKKFSHDLYRKRNRDTLDKVDGFVCRQFDQAAQR
jgi:hypothetical protein